MTNATATATKARSHKAAPGQMEAALSALPREVVHSLNHFDLFDTIDRILPHPMMRAKVKGSLHWAMNNTIINAARSLFWDTKREASATSFSEMLNIFAGARDHDTLTEAMGFSLNANTLTQIGRMCAIATDWGDAAESSAMSAKLNFKPNTIEGQLASERIQGIDTSTKEKIKLEAEMMVDSDETEADRALYEELLLKEQADANERAFNTRRETMTAVLHIVEFARSSGEADVAFNNLPTTTQVQLIRAALWAIDRSISDLRKFRSITAIEYIGILKEAKAAKKELEAILNDDKFKV